MGVGRGGSVSSVSYRSLCHRRPAASCPSCSPGCLAAAAGRPRSPGPPTQCSSAASRSSRSGPRRSRGQTGAEGPYSPQPADGEMETVLNDDNPGTYII